MKKAVSVMLTVLIVLSALSVSASAAGYTEVDEPAGTAAPKIIYRDYVTDEYGAKRRVDYDSDGNIIEYENTTLYTSSSSLPSSYDARTGNRVTSVKNQNPFGTCWSFAFCSAAESSLISQGYETKDSVDLSEAHLAWFRMANYVEGSSIPVQQDRRNSPTGESTFEMGGNVQEAAAAVARWSGLVNESDFPYSTNEADMQFPASTMFDNDYNVTSVVIYDLSNTDEIKQAIINNGALSTAIYYDGNYEKLASSYASYYQNVTSGTNHAVTCVGWDDNFSASNFKYRPAGNGAWLIKNSWGKAMNCGGYLWVSYYDPSITEFAEVNAKPSGDYDNNYQYDGQVELYAFNTSEFIYAANIFTAEGEEKVNACGFWVYDGAPYEITASVYTGLKNASNPSSGTLRESKAINTSHEGYYTVDFDNEYSVSAGEKFSIVIKIKNLDNDIVNIPFEYNGTPYYTYSYDLGQSFFSYYGSSWYDMAEMGYGNIPIKAFTVNESADENVVFPKEGKDTVIDDANGFIYGLNFGIRSLDSYITLADGYTYSCDRFGTGGKVDVYNGTALVKTYELVIFGDINSDGWADGTDAVIVNCMISGLLPDESDAVLFAADCNHDGQTDSLDLGLISDAGLLIFNINQSDSEDDLLNSASYQEYSQIISQVIESDAEETTVKKAVTPTVEEYAKPQPNFFEIIISIIINIIKSIFS